MTSEALLTLQTSLRREIDALRPIQHELAELQPQLREAAERGDLPAVVVALDRANTLLEAIVASQERIAAAQERLAAAAEAPPPSGHLPVTRDSDGFILEVHAFPLS